MPVALPACMRLPRFTRREFCVQSCQAVSFAALMPAIAGCQNPNAPSGFPSLPTISASASSGAIVLPIDAASPLATVGEAALVQAPNTAHFLVARTGENTFSAVTAECTHVACQITTFQTDTDTYECPCHGSQFSTSGAVRRGPASRDLRRFETSFADGVLRIAV